MKLLKIDGSVGHGGGQILRTSLALSSILGIPFEMSSIRSRRPNPGLRRQHLCGVKACAEICGAKAEGAELGSESLQFIPKKIKTGSYQFNVGSGGSTTLVLQSVLLPLAVQKEPSTIKVMGGTYCPGAPTGEFFTEALVPRMNQMGYTVAAEIIRSGFFRAGGGIIDVNCCHAGLSMPVNWVTSETPRRCLIQLIVSRFPEKTILKISKLIREELEKMKRAIAYDLEIVEKTEIEETGAAVIVKTEGKMGASVFSEIAAYGYSSEALAKILGKQIRAFFAVNAPIEIHLADQLILPLFFAAGGRFITTGLSEHLESCCQILELFTGQKVDIQKDGKGLIVDVPKLRGNEDA